MASFNRIVLVGNLTRDPEYKQLSSGQGVCKLGLATNRQFKNKQTGSMIQEVCYIDVDVWGAQAESCRQYLQKGREVLIEGRLKQDFWDEANGQKRNKHSVVADRVVFLGAGADNVAVETAAGAEAGAEFEEASKGLRASGAIKAGNGTKASVAGAVRSEPVTTRPEPQSEMEKDLFNQIDEIKSRTAKRTASRQQEPTAAPKKGGKGGEIDFKDEPPFEDELPF